MIEQQGIHNKYCQCSLDEAIWMYLRMSLSARCPKCGKKVYKGKLTIWLGSVGNLRKGKKNAK